MRTIIKLIMILSIGVGSACSGDDGENIVDPTVDPTAVTLNFPLNNTECHEGSIVSETLSEVVFKWTITSANNSYTVSLKNLETGVTKNYSTVADEIPITIVRGAPYSWSVTSKIAGNPKTVESSVWKFYNAGLPSESHPPFPAEVEEPAMGSSVSQGVITLEWVGGDVDDDIVSYEVLLDKNIPPTANVGNSSSNSLEVTIESQSVYYWKVVTTDALGNTSDSQIFQFKVN